MSIFTSKDDRLHLCTTSALQPEELRDRLLLRGGVLRAGLRRGGFRRGGLLRGDRDRRLAGDLDRRPAGDLDLRLIGDRLPPDLDLLLRLMGLRLIGLLL